MKLTALLLTTGIIAELLTLPASAQIVSVSPTRHQPEFESYSFCPPEGTQSEHADPELNRKKNRVDRATDYGPWPVELIDIRKLTYPQGIEKRNRSEWTPQQRIDVGRWEGIAVHVEGYLTLTSIRNESVGAKPSAEGSWNCGLSDDAHVDYVLWLTGIPEGSKAKAIVAVITPRIRAHQRYWTIENLTRIAKRRYLVRIYGWLMLDQEHPEQVGKSRATLWEIHPITQIDYFEHRTWEHLEFRAPSLAE